MDQRDYAIDGLRGFAVAAVVGCHIAKLCACWGQCGEDFFCYGACGAHLILMICGFSMAAVLNQSPGLWKFVVARFSKGYPVYALSLAISAVLIVYGRPPCYSINQAQFVANLTMCQSWLGVPDIDGAYWIVATILKFYVLIGIGVLIGFRNRVQWFAMGYLVVAIVWQVVSRLDLNVPDRIGGALNAQFAHLFIVGMLAWCITAHGPSFLRTLAVMACFGLEAANIKMPMASAIIAGLMLLCCFRNYLPFLKFVGFRAIGRCAHAAYMVHGVVAYVLMKYLFGTMPLPALVVLTFMVVFVAANAVTQFMEPFSDLIYRYYFPRVKQYRIVGETRFEQESFEGVRGVTDWRQLSDG